jgi:hypothetical protein
MHSDTPGGDGLLDMGLVLPEGMQSHWTSRPEIAIPAVVILVWVAAATVYAAVFSY